MKPRKFLIVLTALVALQLTAASLAAATFLMHQNESRAMVMNDPCHAADFASANADQADCFSHCLEKNQRDHEPNASLNPAIELPKAANPGPRSLPAIDQNSNTSIILAAAIRPPPNQSLLTIQKRE